LQDSLSLQAEQEVWDAVEAANRDLTPHSRVRRDQIILIPSSAETLLPVSGKGEVIIRHVETLFAEQIERLYPLYKQLPYAMILDFMAGIRVPLFLQADIQKV
jgi:hypothetical protein